MAAAAVKSSRRGGGGGSGEDFSAWLGGAGYSEGDVRDIVAETLHGSRSDPTCENWEEVEQLCDHLDRWSPEERITMLDIVVAASADDDSRSDLEGGKDDERDVVYVVSGTATAAAATAVLKAPDGASDVVVCGGDGEGESSRSSTSSTGSTGSSGSSTRPSSAGSIGNVASRSTSTSSSGSSSSSGGSGPLRSINRNEAGASSNSGSVLKATPAGWGTHITRTCSTPDSRTTTALHAPASPDLLARAAGGAAAAAAAAASAEAAAAGASKLSFSGPLQLARKLTGLSGRGRGGSPTSSAVERSGSPINNGNGSGSGRNSGLSGRSSSPTPLSPSPLTSRRRLAPGASGASASRTGSPLRVTLCRAASSNPGELSGVSTAAERLIAAMGTHTSSTSLPASSVSSPVGSGTFLGSSLFSAGAHAAGVGNSDDPSKESSDGARGEDSGNLLPGRNQRLFRAGVSDKSARVRVNFRSMGGKEDNAEGERSGSAAAAAAAAGGDVGVAVSYLDSVGAMVTGVELVLDESGEDCTGLYLSCQPASVLADKAGAAAAGGGAVGGAAGEATAAPLHSAPCRLQLDQQQIGSDLLLA